VLHASARVVGAQQLQRAAAVAPLQRQVAEGQLPQLAGVERQANDSLAGPGQQAAGLPAAVPIGVFDHRPALLVGIDPAMGAISRDDAPDPGHWSDPPLNSVA
jgi:hypothetical protein